MKLGIFDFDNTIIDVNSDTFIDKLLIGNDDNRYYKYPAEIEDAYIKTRNWTNRMNAVFAYMRNSHSIKQSDLIECLNEIKISDSMLKLINQLKENGYTLAIVSDANTVFIDAILRRNQIADCFYKVFTNPAEFDEQEKLLVRPFSEIFNESGKGFDCETKICSTNICKGGKT
jgi:pyridoxal phosphate phosphatase PHOSPHO2